MALNLLQADKGQEFLCEGFLNLHNLLFPLQKKKNLPWKWFVWLSEVALKPVLEPEQLLSLGSGVEDREGLPKDVPMSAACAKGNLRVHVFGATTVTSSSFILKQTPGGSAFPAVLPARLYIDIS